MPNRDSFYRNAHVFLDKILEEIRDLGVSFPAYWSIDHLCYRVNTLEGYREAKEALSSFADLMIESPVNGRNISTFELHNPVEHGEYVILHVELPEPKPGSDYADGFEHIEVVCDMPLDELSNRFPALQWQKNRRRKVYNDEIKAQLKSGAVKFHNQSLASVIGLEKNRSVYDALLESKVLEDLSRFQPLVAGTFPLELNTPESDVDLILSHTNLQEIEEALLKYYSYLPGFNMSTSCIIDRHSLTAQFLWKNIPFEIFAQRQPSFEQNGYRHFILEERLLRIGGKPFRDEVSRLRLRGLKTEPAFAKALSLNGEDPYSALLELYSLSDIRLKAYFR